MADNSGTERPKKRGPGKPFPPGTSGNPGGRKRTLVEVERMLDEEHRNVEKMRETFGLIRQVAHGVDEPVFFKGEVCGHVRKYDGAWMTLYLNRVLGPVQELEVDLTDAPDEVVRWWADNVN
jgi:hypothetical protein